MPKRKSLLTKTKIRSTINHRIESMVNEIKTLIVRPKHTWLKIAAAVIISLAIIGLIILRFRKITPAIPQKQELISHELDTCSVTKEGNPLVESLSNQPDSVQGNFRGKITDLEFDQVLNSYFIKLTSLDNSQSYKFMVRDDKGTFLENSNEASGSALRTNQIVKLSFTCDKKSNGFTVTRVLIEAR